MSLDSEFKPRKEFNQTDSIHHDFGLVALSGNSSIRLYSFPQSLVSRLRSLLTDRIGIASFREDSVQNFYEITMDGKPWGSPKSVLTESLLVSILAVIYESNYSFLSLLDYGREHDDRLAMAFSSRIPSPSNSKQSLPLSNPKRVPFAISFPSPTLLRVISPPLDSTPAILQAVRSAWPRGVVSEKKVGDDTFEFKLKGYRWFQEDTFATDSLRHILTLLSSLDAHSFSLLTSVSLTNRSRVKDLWVFTGLAPLDEPGSIPHSSLTSSPIPNLLPTPHNIPHDSPRPHSHRKLASEPTPNSSQFPEVVHQRFSSDDDARNHSNTLRKPAPRARIPVSVNHDDSEDGYQTILPSVISEGNEDMTGVGAALMQHPDLPDTQFPPSTASPERNTSSPARTLSPSPNQLDTVPPSTIPMPPTTDANLSSGLPTPSTIRDILSPGAFRDSALTTQSEISREVPIQWVGSTIQAPPKFPSSSFHQGSLQSDSSVPQIPGGWQPTPLDEKIPTYPTENATKDEVSFQEPSSVTRLPEFCQGTENRKSEAAIVGLTASPERIPDVPNPTKPGTGWVMVNVEEGGKSAADCPATTPEHPKGDSESASDSSTPGTHVSHTSIPECKEIVVQDALDNVKSKISKKGIAPNSQPFSTTKDETEGPPPCVSEDTKVAKPAKKAKLSLRQRLRLIGTPQASRNEGKRRSIN